MPKPQGTSLTVAEIHTTPPAPMTFENRLRLAEMLVTTGFLPPSIRTPAQAIAVIQTGHELGIAPMHALRSIVVIQNKPALSSELQLALFKAKGGRARWDETTTEKAVLWLRHPNGDEHTETVTLDDAKRANLLGKDSWRHYPKQMLRARAISGGIRAVAPDILAGFYSPEELGADEGPEGEVVVLPDVLVDVSREEQTDYLRKMLSSPVIKPAERDAYLARAAEGESLATLYNEVLKELKSRGANSEPLEPKGAIANVAANHS